MPQISTSTATVYLDGKQADGVQVLSCSFGKGVIGLATAELLFGRVGQNSKPNKIENLELAVFAQPSVEIVIDGDGGERVIWCGDILARHYELSETSDVRVTARVEDHHFGLPLDRSWFWNPKTSQPIGLDLPTVFNPELDGTVWPNCSQRQHPKLGYPLLLHPESQQTDAAKEYAKSPNPTPWDLAEVVYYLCQTLNIKLSGGQDVQNPTLAELYDAMPSDKSLVRNYEAPFGKYLPAQLDRLLEPFGYGWTVESSARGKRKIRVFARGSGKPADIRIQQAGGRIDPKLSNVEGFKLSADVAKAVNAVTVIGDYKRFERSFILQKAWDPKYDDRKLADLELNADAWKDEPELSRVWRDWILNEAGDYNGLRPEITKPYDFDELFGKGEWVARRRVFEPCLSLDADGSPRGVLRGIEVEWGTDLVDWHPISKLPADERTICVLGRECGIRFDGQRPPWTLLIQSSPQFARVRVTATVASDTRIRFSTGQRDSLLDALNPIFIARPSGFKFRQRNPNSKFLAWTNLNGRESSEADDRSQIRDFAEKIVGEWNTASVAGPVTLIGVDHRKLAVGQVLNFIPARQLGFSLRTGSSPRYPQVIGIHFDFEKQATTVSLEAYSNTLI